MSSGHTDPHAESHDAPAKKPGKTPITVTIVFWVLLLIIVIGGIYRFVGNKSSTNSGNNQSGKSEGSTKPSTYYPPAIPPMSFDIDGNESEKKTIPENYHFKFTVSEPHEEIDGEGQSLPFGAYESGTYTIKSESQMKKYHLWSFRTTNRKKAHVVITFEPEVQYYK